MLAKTVDVSEVQKHLTKILSLVASGTEIILTKGKNPVARLTPVASSTQRIPGLHSGAIWVSDDFDAPLSEEFWMGKS